MTASSPGMTPLTRTSSRVVAASKLLRRKTRDARGQFLAEGPQAVAEAVRVAGTVETVFVTDDAARRHTDSLAQAAQHGAQLWTVSPQALSALTETVHPQGIVAVCRHVDVPAPRDVELAVVLDGISDPGNAGTILRTADAAGAAAVVFPHGSTDPYNGKCVRAAAGSLFHLPVVRGGDTADHLDALRGDDTVVLAADAHGTTDLDAAIDDGVLRAPTVWLFGSEAHGLAAEVAALADLRVRVPIWGAAESLNLATAAAVCLYASAREHRKGDA